MAAQIAGKTSMPAGSVPPQVRSCVTFGGCGGAGELTARCRPSHRDSSTKPDFVHHLLRRHPLRLFGLGLSQLEMSS